MLKGALLIRIERKIIKGGNMNDDDVSQLLRRIGEKVGQVDEKSLRMFRLLVTVTLQYRDQLRAQGEILTVEETKKALNVFRIVLKTREIPEELESRARELVMLWLQEIKKTIHH